MLVKIKEWDVLEKEFGLDEDGDISNGGYIFTKFLNSILPKNRIINIDDSNRYILINRQFNIANNIIDDSYTIEKKEFNSKEATINDLNKVMITLKDFDLNTKISFSDDFVYILNKI